MFKAFKSYSVIVHRELVDDLFLHERKLQFLHCKTTTSWAISTRKSRHPTCNKDPLSNLIPHHFITNHQRRKSSIPFSSSYSSSHIRRKKQKKSRTPDSKIVSKKPKRLRHQKNHLSHPSVIEKSIKRVQNKDVRKSQRKS